MDCLPIKLRTRRKLLPSHYPICKHMLTAFSDFIYCYLQQMHTSRAFPSFITSWISEHVLMNHCEIVTSMFLRRQDDIVMNLSLNFMLLPSNLKGGRSRKPLFTSFSVFSGFLLRQHHSLLVFQYRSSYRLRRSIWLASRASRFKALHHRLQTTALSFSTKTGLGRALPPRVSIHHYHTSDVDALSSLASELSTTSSTHNQS